MAEKTLTNEDEVNKIRSMSCRFCHGGQPKKEPVTYAEKLVIGDRFQSIEEMMLSIENHAKVDAGSILWCQKCRRNSFQNHALHDYTWRNMNTQSCLMSEKEFYISKVVLYYAEQNKSITE